MLQKFSFIEILFFFCILSLHSFKMFPQEFHKGPSINSMLEIIEIGFKSNPQAKCQAFIAWRSLITNFGLDTSKLLLNVLVQFYCF